MVVIVAIFNHTARANPLILSGCITRCRQYFQWIGHIQQIICFCHIPRVKTAILQVVNIVVAVVIKRIRVAHIQCQIFSMTISLTHNTVIRWHRRGHTRLFKFVE